MQDEKPSRLAHAVAEALGTQRMEAVAELADRVAQLDAMTVDADTMDVVLVPLKGRAAKDWEMLALRRREDWVFLTASA